MVILSLVISACIKAHKKSVLLGTVEKQNIQLIRAAMGVDEDWGAGNFFTNEPYYQALLDSVVQAAIDLDIYVVIDYHSHRAHENVENAKKFFEKNAQKWGAYDNVIFDIYNEPACIKNGNGDCFSEEFGSAFVNWNTIKDYSDQVIEVIRKYSDNLIIVGTPVWSQRPDEAINAPVKDPANNVAYGFHFYAGSHTVRGWGIHPEKAIKKGIALFVGEWGTVNAVIKGKVSPNNTQWQMWMNRFKLSSANWSLTNLVEDQSKADNSDGQGGSYFAADFDPKKIDGEWKYSESGKWVNENVFKDLPTQYKKCTKYVQSEFVKP